MPHQQPHESHWRVPFPEGVKYDDWAAEVAEQYRREARRDRIISGVLCVVVFVPTIAYGAHELISRI